MTSTLIGALASESLKLKRTLALSMVVAAPLIVVFLQFINYLQRGEALLYPGADPWIRFSQSVLVLWSMLMLPLFITLESALLAGLEHGQNQWRHLFALPVPRWAIYAAKLVAAFALIGLGNLVLWGATLLAGTALRLFKPALGFGQSTPFLGILNQALLIYLASWLILAIHSWVSIRSHSFTFAVGLGIAATFIGLIVSSTNVGRIYPWSLPLDVLFGQGERLPFALALGIGGGLILAIVGGWDITHRDVL